MEGSRLNVKVERNMWEAFRSEIYSGVSWRIIMNSGESVMSRQVGRHVLDS